MKNTLDGMNRRLGDIEQCISNLKDRIMEVTQSEQQKGEQIFKNENGLRDLWDNINRTNIWLIEFPKGEEREKRVENVIDKTGTQNFPNLKKETDIQVQEAQRVPNKMNSKRPTPRHIIIKMAKVKDKKKNFKLVREKESHIKGDPPNAVSFSRNSAVQKEVAWYI